MCILDKMELVHPPDHLIPEEWMWEEGVMATLFREDVLSVGFDYDKGQLIVTVCANDIMVPGSDSEDIANELELLDLIKEWQKYGSHGVIRWLCKKRNTTSMKPSIRKYMQDSGSWDDEMDALPIDHQWYEKMRRK